MKNPTSSVGFFYTSNGLLAAFLTENPRQQSHSVSLNEVLSDSPSSTRSVKKISEIVNETKDAGSYEQSFNASQLSSGIYFYRIEATSTQNAGRTFVETKKMVLLR